jgi:hypothetical protein
MAASHMPMPRLIGIDRGLITAARGSIDPILTMSGITAITLGPITDILVIDITAAERGRPTPTRPKWKKSGPAELRFTSARIQAGAALSAKCAAGGTLCKAASSGKTSKG